MNTRRGLGRGLGALIPTAPPLQRPAEPGRDAFTQTFTAPTPEPESPAAGRVATDRLTPDGSGADGSAADRSATETPTVETPASEHSAPEGWARESSYGSDSTSSQAERLEPVAGATYAELPVDRISPNPRQPREVFDEEAMAELVASINEVGLLQPVVVRRTGANAYELIMGERRLRATQEAGHEVIPAIIRSTSDEDLLRDALLENLHRAQLNPLEEAAAYSQLLDDFGCTHEELALRLGRSRPQITNTIRLLKLAPAVQRRVAAGVLSAGHARALLGLQDADAQGRLAHRIVAEGLSVRAAEEIVSVGGSADAPRARRQRRGAVVAPRLADLAARLSERYDTRVRVDTGRSKGRITVEYGSIEDLERIVALMDPPVDGSLEPDLPG
jgi:ParB family chromosome partitioning protein